MKLLKYLYKALDVKTWTRLAKIGVDALLINKEAVVSNEGLTERNLKATLEHTSISSFLRARSYRENKDGVGIYEMDDGRKGIIFQIFPSPYPGPNEERTLSGLFNEIVIDDSVVQFITFASRNVDEMLMDFERLHPCNVNVKHPKILKEMIRTKIKYFRKWSRESMLKGRDFRVRTFVNLVAISVPSTATDTQIETMFYSLRGSLQKEFSPTNFPANKLVALVQEVLNPDWDSWDAFHDHNQWLNYQMAPAGTNIKLNTEDGTFSLGKEKKDGKGWKGASITTSRFPKDITMHEFKELLFAPFGQAQMPLPCPFLMTLTVHIQNIEENIKKAKSKAQGDYKEIRKAPLMIKKVNPEVQNREAEALDTIYAVEELGEVPLDAMWSLTIFEEDQGKLDQYIGMVKKEFRLKNWYLLQEKFAHTAFSSMIYSLPLQFHSIAKANLNRFRLQYKANNGSIAPVIGDTKGFGRPINMYVGRSGQLMGYDVYNADNYNLIGVGGSGSGKSYSEADNQICLLGAGFKVVVVDIGESYKFLNEIIGGGNIQVSEKNPVCFNFFTRIMDTEYIDEETGKAYKLVHEDELTTIVPLIGMMVGVNMKATSSEAANVALSTKALSEFIEQAIQMSYVSKGKDAGMRDVYDALIEIERERRDKGKNTDNLDQLVTGLRSYGHPEGKFFKYFNGPSTLNLDNDYIVLELEELLNKGELLQVVVMSFASQVATQFWFDRERPKYFLVDETWRIMDNDIMASFLEELYRRIRKYNGSVKTITQSIMDYFNPMTPRAAAIPANAEWRWYCRQKPEKIDEARAKDRISVTDFAAALMKSVNPNFVAGYGELLIEQSKGMMMCVVKLDPFSHAICNTSSPSGRSKYKQISQKYDIDYYWTAKFLEKLGSGEAKSEEEAMRLTSKEIEEQKDDEEKAIKSEEMETNE